MIKMKNHLLKVSLLIIAIIGLTYSPVFSQMMQPLFSVNQNNLSEEVVTQLKSQIETSEIVALSLAKNNRNNDVYQISLSSEQKTEIIILNEQTGSYVVITPVKESLTEFQLSPFFIEELRQGTLGDAEHYLVVATTSDSSVQSVASVSTSNGEVSIPRYFYGEKEDVQEALPKERQIIRISKAKPRLIPAFPNDPEERRRIAQLEEEKSYYLYLFKLPDGTLCTYDENLNPEN
jgi:RNA-binding protein YhbY